MYGPSDETLNRGPVALLLRRLYEFPFGINIVQFSMFFNFLIQPNTFYHIMCKQCQRINHLSIMNCYFPNPDIILYNIYYYHPNPAKPFYGVISIPYSSCLNTLQQAKVNYVVGGISIWTMINIMGCEDLKIYFHAHDILFDWINVLVAMVIFSCVS